MCIRDRRDAGSAKEIVLNQVAKGLQGLAADQVASVTLAYEPVWAIGTGRTATPDQAQEMHETIRDYLASHYPSFVAQNMRIQYGGSVKPHNAHALLSQKDIDGALIGGASLKVDSFVAIIKTASEITKDIS